MTVVEVDRPPSTRWRDPADALAFLRGARSRLRSGVLDPSDMEPTLQAIEDGLNQLLGEHGGLAEELLSAYEQLGIVFDVTRRLPEARDESALVDLFLGSLRRTFAGRTVFAAHRGSEGHWECPSFYADEAFQPLIRATCESKRVRVWPEDDDTVLDRVCVSGLVSGGAPIQAMMGPIVSGHDVRHCIVLLRPAAAPEFRRVDMLLLESLATFCGDLLRNQQLMQELREMSVAMVRSLVSAVDQKDPYTCGHSVRVAYFATELARQLNQGAAELRLLQWSALLHDVGKIGIRHAVLNKPGKLTEEEFAHMKEHPVRSHQVVSRVPQLHGALDGVLYHHEHYDGSGYPEGLAGEAIPLQARIIQIADVFDALTSDRSYRAGHDWRRALAIMRDEAGRTIDPQLQPVFDRMVRARLEGDGDAWADLVAEANEFTHLDSAKGPDAWGTGEFVGGANA